MYSQAELLTAIDDLQNCKHSIQNCAKLAALYTVLHSLYPTDSGYSADPPKPQQGAKTLVEFLIDDYGETEFLKAIEGKDPKKIWLLMDDLMQTLYLINKPLYNSVLNKIDELN